MINFTKDGYLEDDFQICSPDEFRHTFLRTSEPRKEFIGAFFNLLEFGRLQGASRIFIGGSFVTKVENPDDLDVLMTFTDSTKIPFSSKDFFSAEKKVDILYCLEAEAATLNAFLALLKRTRSGRRVGIIQINLDESQEKWKSFQEPDEATFNLVRNTYSQRSTNKSDPTKGVLITIHGILSDAGWNYDVAPIASSQDWIVAPFFYGKILPWVLFSSSARQDLTEQFREWVWMIKAQYPYPISVIAHSFGTYILGSYLELMKAEPTVDFNAIILAGSILKDDFEWVDHWRNVSTVRNEICKGDKVVGRMPTMGYPGKAALFGRSGVNGFSCTSGIVSNCDNKVFGHSNMIKPDVISARWMPFLNASRMYPQRRTRRPSVV